MSTAGSAPLSQPLSASEQVRLTLFRILAVLRVVVLGYAVVVNLGRLDEMARPGLAWAGLAAMAAWTVLADLVHEVRRGIGTWFYVLDVAVTCGALLLTLATHSQVMRERGDSSLPTLWVMGAVLAVSVGIGWWQAVLAAVAVSVVDVAVRVETTTNTWANIFLLTLAAAAVGAMATALCRSAVARAAAERLQAALDERARLARAVHDGVLQVLAMVQRRARDRPDLEDLGRLAAEQEASLRALVQYDARAATRDGTEGAPFETVAALPPQDKRQARPTSRELDLAHAVQQVAGSHTLSTPGRPVLLPAAVVAEVVAAVAECLLNVRRHVAEDARAWVLVEDLEDEVVVTVRDEGSGISATRLAEASTEGRMGVSGSIVGRMEDLGGRAELTTGPTIGTEWELHVPRTAPDQEGRPRDRAP